MHSYLLSVHLCSISLFTLAEGLRIKTQNEFKKPKLFHRSLVREANPIPCMCPMTVAYICYVSLLLSLNEALGYFRKPASKTYWPNKTEAGFSYIKHYLKTQNAFFFTRTFKVFAYCSNKHERMNTNKHSPCLFVTGRQSAKRTC